MVSGWVLAVVSFFAGSIPVGYLVGRAQGIDVTQVGSGNIGATNIGRVLGKKAGAFCLAMDILKGFVPALVFRMIVDRPIFGFGFRSEDFGLICGGLAMLGHMYSPFLKFRGGKGIATGLGMLLGSAWPVGISVLIGFGVAFALTRIVSLASLVAVATLLAAGFYFTPPPLFWSVYALLAAVIVWKHKPNIERLLKGEEKRFEFGGREKVDPVPGGDSPSDLDGGDNTSGK